MQQPYINLIENLISIGDIQD